MVVVVRGSPGIHARANGRGRVHEREGVAGRRTMSARSYAPVLILILILALARVVLGLRVTQGGIVGRGRVSE
jgi:hypothetical protein